MISATQFLNDWILEFNIFQAWFVPLFMVMINIPFCHRDLVNLGHS